MVQRRLDRGRENVELSQVIDASELLAMRDSLEQVEVAPDLLDYAVAIVRATRDHPADPGRRQPARQPVPRAAGSGGGAHALARLRHPGRHQTDCGATLAHRVVLRPELWVRQVSADDVIAGVLATVPTPRTDPSAYAQGAARVAGRRATMTQTGIGHALVNRQLKWKISRHARRLSLRSSGRSGAGRGDQTAGVRRRRRSRVWSCSARGEDAKPMPYRWASI